MIRRDFIKTVGIAGAAFSVLPSYTVKGPDSKKAKIAFIGLGGRGRWHLKILLNRNDIEVPAICDIAPDAIEKSLSLIEENGYKKPDVYSDSEFAFEKLLQRDDIEGVIISTPWLWHTRMAVASMRAGKYAGVEVSAANTLEECWDLVNTYEETGIPVMILENVCYRQDVMVVLRMVRKNLFGELIHFRCGYQHDVRKLLLPLEKGGMDETHWRTAHSLNRNGDVYPTHGIGPIATFCDINHGNRFVSLASTATKARGLHDYILNHPKGGARHPNARINWKQGDVVTTTVTTARGESIIITYDCSLPRPYSLGFRIQGTKGIAELDQHTKRIYIEDISEKEHRWEDFKEYAEKYKHPLIKKYEEQSKGSGHGGMDFFVDHAFVEIVKRKLEAPLDAYDAAAWSSITPLSEMSIAEGGEPVPVPDFTKGQWMRRKPVFGLNDDY